MTDTPSRVGARWHDERRKQLLRDHPEVRDLAGRDPWSLVWIIVLGVAQVGLAIAVHDKPWWVVVAVAYGVGTLIAHALGVLIHEAAHDLILETATANRLVGILANIPLGLPGAMDFRESHLAHHAHLGVPGGADPQAPQRWDFGFVTNRFRRFIWHLAGPVLGHLAAPAKQPSRWVLFNIAVNVLTMVPFTIVFGPKVFVYIGASGVLGFGWHPVGARRYGEHLTLREGQPTASYYGPLNWIGFQVGHHVEHHDLPSVPWSKLRTLRATAPELYRDLASIPSWTALLVKLLVDEGEGPNRYFLEPAQKSPAKNREEPETTTDTRMPTASSP